MLQAMAIAETGEPSVVGDQGEVIRIAEEYANGGIDFLIPYDRADRDRTLVALAGLISGTDRSDADVANRSRRPVAARDDEEPPVVHVDVSETLEEEEIGD
jgi:hypothetical protein